MRLYQFLLPITVLAVAAAQFVLPGPIGVVANRPGVTEVAAIPAHANLTKLQRFLDYQAIVLPEDFPTTPTANPGPPRLGYGYREISVFKLPLFAYRELGFVLVDSDGMRQRMVPLDADYMKLLEKEAGQPLGQGYVFPVWLHLWGWLVVAALIASLVSWRREENARREAAGII